MNYVGIDIGSTASKVVIRGDRSLSFVLPTGWNGKETAMDIDRKLKESDIDVASEKTKVAATGYGRISVSYADYVITEITCHARGARVLAGDNCAVIDVGGQDTKVILVENGAVQDFLMNDKCSAGTGKFLEIMQDMDGIGKGTLDATYKILNGEKVDSEINPDLIVVNKDNCNDYNPT